VLSFLGRHADAGGQIERLGDLPRSLSCVLGDLDFYAGLNAAALAHAVDTGRWKRRRRLARAIRRLRTCAQHGPDFAHMAELLLAEQAGLLGRVAAASAHYTAAVRRAQQQGYVHHAALAHERHAELLRRARRETECEQAMNRALELYAQWGAAGKVARLRSALEKRA
jgi:hypothetical protein